MWCQKNTVDSDPPGASCSATNVAPEEYIEAATHSWGLTIKRRNLAPEECQRHEALSYAVISLETLGQDVQKSTR